MSRFLITTADERTWRFDTPVLFLGEFCQLYDRRDVWNRMDGIVAAPFGADAVALREHLQYVERVCSSLMAETAIALNAFHGVRHGTRYWSILLGHWLRRYVMITSNRYFTVETALQRHEVTETRIRRGAYGLATESSSSLVLASNDDTWNQMLIASILRFMGGVNIERVPDAVEASRFVVPASLAPAPPGGVRAFARRAISAVLPMLARDRDAFMVGTYLPRATEIRLQLSLGQCPQLWRSPLVNYPVPEPSKRQPLTLSVDGLSGYDAFVRLQVGEMIPSCFLEGYSKLTSESQSVPWPSKPRFIFTSNNFDTDEVFKAWTAEKVEAGVPYYTGQHGNTYGTHVHSGNRNWPERSQADRFLSWGWSDDSGNVCPAFNFKHTSDRSRFDPGGGLLLVELCLTHQETPWDPHAKFADYQEDQFRFVAALLQDIHQELTVRLHSGHRLQRWNDPQRWRDRSPHTRVEPGAVRMRDAIARSRLVVHSYDGTGFLEVMTANVPTVCFWRPDADLLQPEAQPHYDKLRDAGILVDSPEAAASKVAAIWNDTLSWWREPSVQHARAQFCDRYARTETRPIRTLRRLLAAPVVPCSTKDRTL